MAFHKVNIPDADVTVSVSMIDTTVRFLQWKIDPFVQKPLINGHTRMGLAPSLAFKITHPTQGTYLFDLGVRKDWATKIPTRSRDIVKKNGWEITIDKDVPEILTENGVDLQDIKGIIWSHWHWDHVGDPSKFPSTTKLVVGPGFKGDVLPGYPADPEGKASSDAWEGREIEEVKIPQDVVIGGYPALDYFGDGSFYLLDAPGHTIGHLCALARTTPGKDSSFIFMGGDVAHLIAQVRPSEYVPLPDKISPDPREPFDKGSESFCPCEGYIAIHPKGTRDKPYYIGSRGMATKPEQAEESTQKVESFDGDDRILTVIAHDDKILEVVDVYPKDANDWKAKNWKKLAHWRYLGDFKPVDA